VLGERVHEPVLTPLTPVQLSAVATMCAADRWAHGIGAAVIGLLFVVVGIASTGSPAARP
jgi:hypothetical protein